MNTAPETADGKPGLTCNDCGKSGPDVEHTCCPYAQEIDGQDEPCDLCGDCYQRRADDI